LSVESEDEEANVVYNTYVHIDAFARHFYSKATSVIFLVSN